MGVTVARGRRERESELNSEGREAVIYYRGGASTVQYLANCEGFIPLDPKVANDFRNLIDTENSCPICLG